MPAPPITSDELSRWRRRLYSGQQLDVITEQRLIDEVERLRKERGIARVAFATRAAQALKKRLQDVASFNNGGCPTCRDAEARAFLVKLEKIAQSGGETSPSKPPGAWNGPRRT